MSGDQGDRGIERDTALSGQQGAQGTAPGRGIDANQESAIDRMVHREANDGFGGEASAPTGAIDVSEEPRAGVDVGHRAASPDEGAGPPDPAARQPDTGTPPGGATPVQLFGEADIRRYRDEWREIQVGFVDDPRSAVDRADGLVAAVLDDLTRTFAEQRGSLVKAWEAGDEVSTEDLRVTLQQYRSFFQRLLSL